jgi:hypothetical protein
MNPTAPAVATVPGLPDMFFTSRDGEATWGIARDREDPFWPSRRVGSDLPFQPRGDNTVSPPRLPDPPEDDKRGHLTGRRTQEKHGARTKAAARRADRHVAVGLTVRLPYDTDANVTPAQRAEGRLDGMVSPNRDRTLYADLRDSARQWLLAHEVDTPMTPADVRAALEAAYDPEGRPWPNLDAAIAAAKKHGRMTATKIDARGAIRETIWAADLGAVYRNVFAAAMGIDKDVMARILDEDPAEERARIAARRARGR